MVIPVALLVVALTSAAAPARDHTAEVRVVNKTFSPETVTVDEAPADEETPGLHAHVNWIFEDPGVDHTVYFDDPSVALPSGRLVEGQTYTVVFEAPGTYTYRCEIHPSMTGTVVVRLPAELIESDEDGSSVPVVLIVVAGVVTAGLAAVLLIVVRRRRASRTSGS